MSSKEEVKRNTIRTEKILRQRRRRKRWLREKNIQNNSRKRFKRRRPRDRSYQNSQIEKEIIVPQNFNLLSGRDEVLPFFRYCKKFNSRICDKLHFNFDNVQNIGNGAMTILLSICGWLNDQGVRVSGSYPSEPMVRNVFEKSGFLKYFNAQYSKKENQLAQNEILQKGIDKTNPKATSIKIRGAMKTVWGKESKNTAIQGMLIELMANTVNHAYEKHQKGWYFSVDYIKEENKAKFCFVDNGQGILNTIKLKLSERIKNVLEITDDSKLLSQAFDGIYGSRTRLSYRGRGLPAIKKCFSNNKIKNLVVISNNVCLNFGTGTCEILKTSFDGTFYYWELDQSCKHVNYGV